MKHESYPWKTFAICWGTGMCAGINASIFSVLLVAMISSLAGTTDKVMLGQLGSYLLSCFLIGWAIGGVGIGIAGDKVGRVRAMALSVLIFSSFSGISALSQTLIQMMACRLMMGIGVGGAMVSMSILVAEHWPSRTRAIAVGSLLTSYQMGVFVSGMLVHLVPEWRQALSFGIFPIVLAILIPFVIKEKPLQVPRAVPSSSFLYEKSSLLAGSLLFGSLLLAYWASASWIPTWIQALAGASSGQEKSLATMWHGVAAVVGCLITGPLVTQFKCLRIVALAFSFAFAITINMMWNHQVFSLWIYVNYAMLGLCIGIGQSSLYIYLPELFPSRIRGQSVGICLNAGRIVTAGFVVLAGIIVPFLDGYANGIILFSLAYIVGFITAITSKETLVQELPD